jgi:hypothetical protein
MEGGLPIKSTIHPIKWPSDQKGWIMRQTWEHLLFAHWVVPFDVLRKLVPDSLQIDTFEGQAWVSIIPFMMTGVRLRGLPPIPFTTTFPEINVRTYVKLGQKSGIYFLSLDASKPMITAIAKQWYRLPYARAAMQVVQEREGLHFQSRRWGKPDGAEAFHASYRPVSDCFFAESGTLEYWLTERYTLFCECSRSKKIFHADVYHEPWRLQKASLELQENTMTHAAFSLEGAPQLALYARGVQSLVWPIKPVKSEGKPSW